MDSEIKPSKLETRYQFHSMIGKGGAGEVFAAWDDHLKRTVAIKRIKPNGLDDATLTNPWNEAIRLAAIRHANIVTVYDMGQDNDLPYIVMEHVQGDTVDDRIASQGVFSYPDFVDLARQSLEGLIAAHHAGLVHRDLKPSNIMLQALPSVSFRVKILDFGMAKFLNTPSAQTMNIDGSITGSISWISPEQLNHQAVDERSDLYSLGCVFYYALSGKEPFHGSNTMEIMGAHFSHNVVPLETHRPDLPAVLAQWVMALINLAPEDRYQSAMQALQALNAIASYTGNLPVPVHSTTSIITPATPAPGVDPSTGAITPVTTAAVASSEAAKSGEPTAAHGTNQIASNSGGAGVGNGKGPQPPVQTSQPPEGTPSGNTQPVYFPEQPKRDTTFNIAIGLVLLILVGSVAYLFGMVRHGNENTPGNQSLRANAPVAASTPAVAQVAATPVPIPSATPMPAATTNAASSPAIPATPVVPAEVVLHIHGSNTIGAKLIPALIAEFLKAQGASSVQNKPGKDPEEMKIEGTLAGEVKAVEIQAHGSATAFQGLLAGECELGMASRQIKPEEATAMANAGLGDLHSSSNEHVLGLDGIAILVNKDNPIASITKEQLAGVFSGKFTDWQDLGGSPGPIHLYARDAKSGTFDTFKSLVLDKLDLAATAKRFEDSNELSDAVAGDAAGIGFVGLPFIGEAKALAVSEAGTAPFIASRFTVATEDYLLSRRLFLYTASASRNNPWLKKFLAFALSDEGQAVVQAQGFVKQTLDVQRFAAPANAPQDYVEATKDADRLSLNLRFRPGSTQLDNKALRDMDRIINVLAQPRFQGKSLLLLGFADSAGPEAANLKISKDRAQLVAKEFALRGFSAVEVKGMGSALPVASNETENGKEKNRRVEVWVK